MAPRGGLYQREGLGILGARPTVRVLAEAFATAVAAHLRPRVLLGYASTDDYKSMYCARLGVSRMLASVHAHGGRVRCVHAT